MGGITLRDGKTPVSFEVDVQDGETFTSPESGATWTVTGMMVSLFAEGGAVSVCRVTVTLDGGGFRGVDSPGFRELSRGLRAYLLDLDAALRAAPFTV